MGLFDGIVSAITSAAPLIGGVAGGIGQAQTNQKNWDISQSQNQANEAMQQSAQNFNADQAIQDRAFQANQAQTNRDWQQQMSNSSYQRAVGDLKAAGLNPMLAYTQGGSSTPSGSAASGSSASISPNRAANVAPMGNVLGAVISGAQQAAQVRNVQEQNELIKAQVHNTDTQSDLTRAKYFNELDLNPGIKKQVDKIMAEIGLMQQQARLSSATEANTRANIAPSTDPYWYRDLKSHAKEANSAWGTLLDKSKTLLRQKD